MFVLQLFVLDLNHYGLKIVSFSNENFPTLTVCLQMFCLVVNALLQRFTDHNIQTIFSIDKCERPTRGLLLVSGANNWESIAFET